jgi:hypothetical protein
MSVLAKILEELDEQYIIDNVSGKHEDARESYSVPYKHNRVADDTEFSDVIADYYNYHVSKCSATGGLFSRSEAAGRAKEIVFQEYRRKGLDKSHAYDDGKTGKNGGMSSVLNIIADRLRDDAVGFHTTDVLDRYVKPTDYNEKLSLIREIFSRMLDDKDPAKNQPERYVVDYEEFVRYMMNNRKNLSRQLSRR